MKLGHLRYDVSQAAGPAGITGKIKRRRPTPLHTLGERETSPLRLWTLIRVSPLIYTRLYIYVYTRSRTHDEKRRKEREREGDEPELTLCSEDPKGDPKRNGLLIYVRASWYKLWAKQLRISIHTFVIHNTVGFFITHEHKPPIQLSVSM